MASDWQFWFVILVEVGAIVYLAGRFGLVPAPRATSKPDVRASSLVRKKRSGAERDR